MKRALRLLAFAPLALTLAACGGSEAEDDTGGLTGEPIAEVSAPDGQEWSQVVTRTEEGGYLMGNPDAPIKLLEFASLSCHVCADFSNDGAAAIKSDFVDSGRVSYEYRNFIRSSVDLPGVQIMECGNPERVIPLAEQHYARFEEFSQALSDPRMQQVGNLATPQERLAFAEISGLLDFFAQRGISRDEAASCLANEERTTELARRNQSWDANYDITGTPTLYINGKKFDATRWELVKNRLEELGAR